MHVVVSSPRHHPCAIQRTHCLGHALLVALAFLLSTATAQSTSQTIRITVPYILQADVNASDALYTHLGDAIEIDALANLPLTVRLSTNDQWTLQIITPRETITIRGTNGVYAPLTIPALDLEDGERVKLIITRG